MSDPQKADHAPLISRLLMDRWAATFIVALAMTQQMLGHQNCDNTWLYTAAERFVEGARPYVDFIETNPPASFLIYLPGVGLARLTGLPVEFVVCACVFVFGLGVILFTGSILRRAHLLKPDDTGLLLNLAVFSFLFVAGLSFAEREHLAAIVGDERAPDHVHGVLNRGGDEQPKL